MTPTSLDGARRLVQVTGVTLPGGTVAGVFGVGNTHEVIVIVGAAEGIMTLELTDGTGIVNQIGLSYVAGTPDPNENYWIVPQGVQTRAIDWAIYE